MSDPIDALRAFIQDEMILDGTRIDNDTSLFSTRLVNSRNLMHIVSFIEKKWAFRISPMDLILENFDTLARMIAYVERKTGE